MILRLCRHRLSFENCMSMFMCCVNISKYSIKSVVNLYKPVVMISCVSIADYRAAQFNNVPHKIVLMNQPCFEIHKWYLEWCWMNYIWNSEYISNTWKNKIDILKLIKFKNANRVFHSTQAPLKNEFRKNFRNVSRILDCVGCEKCKLHGKVCT